DGDAGDRPAAPGDGAPDDAVPVEPPVVAADVAPAPDVTVSPVPVATPAGPAAAAAPDPPWSAGAGAADVSLTLDFWPQAAARRRASVITAPRATAFVELRLMQRSCGPGGSGSGVGWPAGQGPAEAALAPEDR